MKRVCLNPFLKKNNLKFDAEYFYIEGFISSYNKIPFMALLSLSLFD